MLIFILSHRERAELTLKGKGPHSSDPGAFAWQVTQAAKSLVSHTLFRIAHKCPGRRHNQAAICRA